MGREDVGSRADRRTVGHTDVPRNRGRRTVEDRGADLTDPKEERRKATRGAPLGGDGAPRAIGARAADVGRVAEVARVASDRTHAREDVGDVRSAMARTIGRMNVLSVEPRPIGLPGRNLQESLDPRHVFLQRALAQERSVEVRRRATNRTSLLF